MRDATEVDLAAQLEEERAAREQAEQEGAELAERALESDQALKRLQERFEQVRSQVGKDTKRVLRLEHWIAFLGGVFIYLVDRDLEGDDLFVHSPDLKLPAYLMCAAPSLYLCLRNGWHRFQIKHSWNSWRDNDFTSGLRQFLNEKTRSH